jgi:hypothetical protein
VQGFAGRGYVDGSSLPHCALPADDRQVDSYVPAFEAPSGLRCRNRRRRVFKRRTVVLRGGATPDMTGDIAMHGQSIAFPDYGFYSTAELIAAFAAGAARYRQATADLTDEEIRSRPRGAGRWSIHEIILHSADSEMQGTFRIRKTWCEAPALWPIHDQDTWSQVLHYQGQGTEARERALTLIAALREQTLPLFRRATAEDWRKSGTHPEFGVLTLRNLLELYADHSKRHVDQILHSACFRRRWRPVTGAAGSFVAIRLARTR